MREIKFRAWDEGAEQMYNWESIKYQFNEHLEHELVKVMQFTGLHDKNGTPIYESDIVRIQCEDWTEDEFEITTIEWGGLEYPAFDLKMHNFDSNGLSYIRESGWYTIEVIGNIYENPELLEQP